MSTSLAPTMINGELRIRDLDLAKRLGFSQARDIRKLIKRNESKLLTFGGCATVARLIEGNETDEFYLNQKQSIFICMKSETDNAFDVQVEIVHVFDAHLNNAPVALPDFNNPVAAARAWADQAEARQLAEQESAAKTLALEAARPAIEFTKRVASAEDCHTLDEAAKILQAGPRKLRQWMRDERILRMDGTPYQDLLNRKLFRVIEQTIHLPHGNKIHAQTFVTGNGMLFLQQRIDHSMMGAEV